MEGDAAEEEDGGEVGPAEEVQGDAEAWGTDDETELEEDGEEDGGEEEAGVEASGWLAEEADEKPEGKAEGAEDLQEAGEGAGGVDVEVGAKEVKELEQIELEDQRGVVADEGDGGASVDGVELGVAVVGVLDVEGSEADGDGVFLIPEVLDGVGVIAGIEIVGAVLGKEDRAADGEGEGAVDGDGDRCLSENAGQEVAEVQAAEDDPGGDGEQEEVGSDEGGEAEDGAEEEVLVGETVLGAAHEDHHGEEGEEGDGGDVGVLDFVVAEAEVRVEGEGEGDEKGELDAEAGEAEVEPGAGEGEEGEEYVDGGEAGLGGAGFVAQCEEGGIADGEKVIVDATVADHKHGRVGVLAHAVVGEDVADGEGGQEAEG